MKKVNENDIKEIIFFRNLLRPYYYNSRNVNGKGIDAGISYDEYEDYNLRMWRFSKQKINSDYKKELINGLVKAGFIYLNNNLYYITDKGKDIINKDFIIKEEKSFFII